MSDPLHWLFPVLCFLLAGLWLRSLLRQRRGLRTGQTPTNQRRYRRTEAEDALKAAYALQTQGRTCVAEELALSLGLPKVVAENLAHYLLAFGWAKEDPPGDIRLDAVADGAVETVMGY